MNIKEHYQSIAGGGRASNEPRLNIVASLIEDKNLKILDIGCYDGEVSSLYKKDTNIVHGADIHVMPWH